MGYLPYTFVAFHLLYAASGPKPKLSWPSVQFEMSSKLQKSENLLKSMIAEMLPASRIFASPPILVCLYKSNLIILNQMNRDRLPAIFKKFSNLINLSLGV